MKGYPRRLKTNVPSFPDLARTQLRVADATSDDMEKKLKALEDRLTYFRTLQRVSHPNKDNT